jgi:hypothetical protein
MSSDMSPTWHCTILYTKEYNRGSNTNVGIKSIPLDSFLDYHVECMVDKIRQALSVVLISRGRLHSSFFILCGKSKIVRKGL